MHLGQFDFYPNPFRRGLGETQRGCRFGQYLYRVCDAMLDVRGTMSLTT